MRIELQQVSRRFGYQNIFSGIDLVIDEGSSVALLGGNGSGKSTLIKIISGALSPSSGKVLYSKNGENIPHSESPFQFALASPYLELIEELTAEEFLLFYEKFKPLTVKPSEILGIAYLQDSAKKEIRNFSSGMKQRLRLALAFFSNVSVILLDEPVSNLDPEGMEWFKELVTKYRGDRTLVVGSNFNEDEIEFCERKVFLKEFKV